MFVGAISSVSPAGLPPALEFPASPLSELSLSPCLCSKEHQSLLALCVCFFVCFETGFHYVTQVDLELIIPLIYSSEY